jgi:Sigma-70, region 4
MDDVLEFCRRILGHGPLADEAAEAARAEAPDEADRVSLLKAAARATRERARQAEQSPPWVGEQTELGRAIAEELAQATARLPERQREALALRELLRLSHEQTAAVLEIEPAAVASLLARARLRLRAERRGTAAALEGCPDHERALRCMTCRLDSEPLSAGDDDWLIQHLGECEACNQAHAAMLEASICYRAWRGRPRTRQRAGA